MMFKWHAVALRGYQEAGETVTEPKLRAWTEQTLPASNTPEAAGHFLAKLALGQIRPPPGRIYAELRSEIITWPDPSELARSDDARDALWRDSSALVGFPQG